MKREGASDLPFPAWTGVILTLFLILMDQGTKLLALSQLKGNPDIILIVKKLKRHNYESSTENMIRK